MKQKNSKKSIDKIIFGLILKKGCQTPNQIFMHTSFDESEIKETLYLLTQNKKISPRNQEQFCSYELTPYEVVL